MAMLLIYLMALLFFGPAGLWAQERRGELVSIISSDSSDLTNHGPETNIDKNFTTLRLEDTVVTASRREEKIFDLPYMIDIIKENEICSRRLSRTTPEIFTKTCGIMVQKTSRGQGSPFIRGFTGFRTLFLIDGIRLNNAIFRDGPNEYWNLVDPFTLSHLEVVKGPASVLYGSDAIGGTVNAVTKIYDRWENRFHSTQRALYRYSSADDAHVSRLEFSVGGNASCGVLTGLSWKDFHDLKGGRALGLQPETGYDQIDGDLKLTCLLSPKAKLILAYQQADQNDAWRTHKTVYGRSWQGTTGGNEKAHILNHGRQLAYAQLHIQEVSALLDKASFSLSYHRLEEKRLRVKKSGQSDRQGFDVHTLGFWSRLESESLTGCWIYGMEYYRDFINSFGTDFNVDGSVRKDRIQGPVGDDATYDLLGIFVQDEIPFLTRFAATAGARYTFARAKACKVADPVTDEIISISDSWHNVVGSLRLLCLLNEQWHFFVGGSQGFRSPNLSDLTRFDAARSDEIETPSPDLNPETYLSLETGIKMKAGPTAAELACFYTNIEDMIERFPTGNLIDGDKEVQKANVGDGFVYGLELQVSCSLTNEWTLHYNISWMEGEVDTFPAADRTKKREPMSRIPPLSATAGLLWEDISGKYWAEALATMAGPQDRLSTRDKADTQRIPPGGTPGHVVFNLHGGTTLARGLSLSAAVENITNEDYRIHGSGQNEGGTNFSVSLDWRF